MVSLGVSGSDHSWFTCLVDDIRMSRDTKFFLFYLIKIFIGIRGWEDGFSWLSSIHEALSLDHLHPHKTQSGETGDSLGLLASQSR